MRSGSWICENDLEALAILFRSFHGLREVHSLYILEFSSTSPSSTAQQYLHISGNYDP